MDRGTYLQLQYQTLRKEIEDSLARSFQIMIGGAALIPILVGVVAKYAATPILMTLPMTVVVVALLYLNQWNSIMRCGRYIRTHIEKPIMPNDGWEVWLEAPPDRRIDVYDNRIVDAYLMYAFYLLIAAYYFATSFVAVTYSHIAYGPIAPWVAGNVYGIIGILLGIIVVRRLPVRTTTRSEREAIPPDVPSSSTRGTVAPSIENNPLSDGG